MNSIDYWKECISIAADECDLSITEQQLCELAASVEGGHENYGMAFYSPPDSDRISDVTRKWEEKCKAIQRELDEYKSGAESAIKRALRQYDDANVSITKNGEVFLHGGRTEQIL